MSVGGYTREELRRPARITAINRGPEDHGIETVCVCLEGREGGWSQGFGMLCMKDSAESAQFVRELCEVFGTADAERLVGQECLALYAESPWGNIEGLEAPSGRRFTIRGWRLRHYPDKALTPTETRRAALVRDIAFHERRAAEMRADLASLPELIDWETAP